MPIASLSTPTLVACGCVLIAVLSLWLPGTWIWMAALGLAVVAGYVAGVLHGVAFLWLVLLATALVLFRRSQSGAARFIWCAAVVGITLLLGMHQLPGFSNPLLARDLVLSSGAAPYSLYFNFDKTFAGILILGIAAVRPRHEWRRALRDAAPIIAGNILLAMVLSLALRYVSFEPKWTNFFWPWALANLLLTCLSEEAFFRAFIQREVFRACGGTRGAAMVAVSASALLFGFAHFAGGWRYVLLASVAGAGYAIVYQRTGSVELSILAHFLLNATHFLFFTYPYLA